MTKISLLMFLVSASLLGQNNEKTCEILLKINILLQAQHYQPQAIDDSLSVYVFDTFVDGLDPNRNIFTKKEYQDLCQHRLMIDNYIFDKDCYFIKDFVAIQC